MVRTAKPCGNISPKMLYESLCNAIDEGRRIDRNSANQIAQGMKTWAMERGATHYSHWFQPLNDLTAENTTLSN